MKYIYIIFLVLLMCVPVTYAEGRINSDQESLVQQDDHIVNGKIVDDIGDPIPGVTITIKGTNQGVITDLDGNFALSAPKGAQLLMSFIGFKSMEVLVDGKTNLGVIILISEAQELDQVVVIGYGTQKKADLTGSVSIVDPEEIRKQSNSNISTLLQGKASGVQITSDGQPGADPTVRIRGIGSFGNTNPLYVIDGVPMGTTIRDFSPNDIESMQILKDASAAAIYGSRAGNGVIIITTKKGKKNSPMKVDYNGYVGVDQVQEGVYDVMNSDQYKDYLSMAYANSGVDLPGGYVSSSSNYLWDKLEDGTEVASVDTDWFNEVYKKGIRQNHNVNLSGGGENNTYNIGLDYFSQEGTMKGAGPNYDRFTARINNTMGVKFIKIQTSVVYSHSDQDNMALSNANEYVQGLYGGQYPVMASTLLLPSTIKAYDESTWVLDDRLSSASGWKYDAYGYGTYYDDVHGDLRMTNVLMMNNLLERNVKVDRFVGSANTSFDLFEMLGVNTDKHKLTYNLNLAYNKTIVKNSSFVPAFISSTINYLPKENEVLNQEYRSTSDVLIENYINYNTTFGKHSIDVVLGQTYQSVYYNSLTGTGNNLSEPYYLQLDNAAERTSYSYESDWRMSSYIGRLNYNFEGKYFISATARRDGSSRLSPEDRFDIFPSVSAGWRIERENFFSVDKSTISLLKLRGSYGELGSIENLGPYDYMDTMRRNDYTYSFNNDKVTGSSISNFVNTGLRWEIKKTLDFGLDLAMFNNQFEFNFDWYESTSEDLHYDVRVPSEAGFTNERVKMNAASMVNSGLEFLFTYRNYNHAVKFELSANLSTLSNKVTKLGVANEPQNNGVCRTEVGREVGEFYGWVLEDDVQNDDGTYSIRNGIAQNQSVIDNRINEEGTFIDQPGAEPGDILYKDLNGDGTINAEDRTFIGSGLPDINFGLNGRVEWNGFDLNIAAFGAGGLKAVDFVQGELMNSYGATNKDVSLLNAWTPTNTDTDVPRVQHKSANATNNYFSDRYIQDASYLRIANVQLGYNFPDRWFKDKVSNVRVYASGQNLATITKYEGYNVDFSGGTFTPGYNYASFPQPRSFMLGLNLSF